MDSLHYWYGANNNHLLYIDDSTTVASSTYTGDLEDQASGNYGYHPIGHLRSDIRDSITYISWNEFQKIGRVEKTDRLITFRYNPMGNRVAKYSKPNASNLEKRTYYVRDAQGNAMATYSAWVKNNSGAITWDSFRLSEQHIYGSSRVGMALTDVKLYPAVPKNPHLPDTSHYPIFEGWKRYEIANHLGNVLAVITDRKRGAAASGTAIQWFDADVVASQQYYPFGMLMPGNTSASLRRQYTLGGNDYRYGFNGKEGDDEVKGDDNQQDYGMRCYDPRVSRFLSVDPIAKDYPMLTPYQFASNTPIWAIDLDGLEAYFTNDGTFLRWGDIKGDKAPVIIVTRDYEPFKFINEMIEINNNNPNSTESVAPQYVEKYQTVTSDGNYVDYGTFKSIAATAYSESGYAKDAILGIANVIVNRHKLYKGTGLTKYSQSTWTIKTTLEKMRNNWDDSEYKLENPAAKAFFSKNEVQRNGNELMKAGFEAALNALTGGKDHSEGGQGWHGVDILSNKTWMSDEKYGIDFPKHTLIGLFKDANKSNKVAIPMFEAIKTIEGRKSLDSKIGTAATIFFKPSAAAYKKQPKTGGL
ncbi:MAG: hypothetical protein DYG98_27360 [Haliscomenobacteraceae bacterium CHB4]|nr:hypothetical protein [Saprospiraceae bacterium]MCE7926774.1 hypothetical protein [Haliscomenobacteraceae bacterium CHB4]